MDYVLGLPVVKCAREMNMLITIQESLELETTDLQQDNIPQMQMSDSGADAANDQYRTKFTENTSVPSNLEERTAHEKGLSMNLNRT